MLTDIQILERSWCQGILYPGVVTCTNRFDTFVRSRQIGKHDVSTKQFHACWCCFL